MPIAGLLWSSLLQASYDHAYSRPSMVMPIVGFEWYNNQAKQIKHIQQSYTKQEHRWTSIHTSFTKSYKHTQIIKDFVWFVFFKICVCDVSCLLMLCKLFVNDVCMIAYALYIIVYALCMWLLILYMRVCDDCLYYRVWVCICLYNLFMRLCMNCVWFVYACYMIVGLLRLCIV